MGGSSSKDEKRLNLIQPNLYHIRADFSVIAGLLQVGTHMRIIKLPNSGKFLVIDTVPLETGIKQEIDELTKNGQDIEAVIATHPFHTLAFNDFYKAYPKSPYYGTPRHLRNLTQIPWTGEISKFLNKWENEGVFFSIPDGAEYVNPQPELTNHFVSVWTYVKDAKTILVDDTLNPGFILKYAVGIKPDTLEFHNSLKGPALVPRTESVDKFKLWVTKITDEWDFDNICCAHRDNFIGGAKDALKKTLEEAEPTFQRLLSCFSGQRLPEEKAEDEKIQEEIDKCREGNVQGSECG